MNLVEVDNKLEVADNIRFLADFIETAVLLLLNNRYSSMDSSMTAL